MRVAQRLATLRSRAALELTPRAVDRLKYLVDRKIAQNPTHPPVGIRLGVRKRGCSGLSYTMAYADKQKLTDEKVSTHGVTVLVEPQALLSVVGTKMDFVDDALKSEFVFHNPNAKTICGCQESFSV